ncbi:MAG: DoxX family protein [Candidatus Omnitrophica bacterium]|nr:DoxX family protein [Candidatus Omnitrophota bacterium]
MNQNNCSEHSRQAYHILKFAFTVAPILAGADKFTNFLTQWSQYLAPAVAKIIPSSVLMPAVGVVEISAGILVALKPRIAAYIVCVWLILIIVNLLLIPGYFDVALRDLGLALGALALGRLSEDHAN